jgi:DNA (cytosine-5)-methyltransferase 1
VTVSDAIGDLPVLDMGEGSDELRRYTRQPKCDFQRLMREGSEGVSNHYAPQLGDVNIERLKYIPQGGSWRDLPHRLLPAGMKQAKRSDHTKRYGRLDPNGLFSTILTKADLHWGAYIHPEQARTLTVRECARAQTFPDKFTFLGSRVDQYRQVGNAVPPLLAKAVAESVRQALSAAPPCRRKATAA